MSADRGSGTALLLAAGLATRLGALRESHAKACVPVDGLHPLGFLLESMQEAGIDSRLASGAANERDGDYRGLHIWLELSLADNGRYLSDQTWNDATIPLWDGAYDVDKRRTEMFHRTDRYRDQVV